MSDFSQLSTLNGRTAGRFAFGTMQFGGAADAAASRAMYDMCRAAGLTHFDTAHMYSDGRSETLLGEFAAAERDKVLIATKVGFTGGGSARNMRQQFDTCRQRLGMDMVDVLYLHRHDPDTDMRDTMSCFAELKAAGQIRYVGLSNFAAWQVMKALRAAAEFDLAVDLLQPMYSLVTRQAEVEILPMCADQKITAATYSPLGAGLLTGKYAGGDGSGRLVEDARYRARYAPGEKAETAARLADLACELGTHPATLAVAWVAAHPAAPVPILSGRNADQLVPSLAAVETPLSPELYARISALSATPPPATDRIEEQT